MTNIFDVLIIGGGVSGMSCALVLGSAKKKSFAADKKIGIFTHQKASALQDALFNNVYGIPAGKLGSELLTESVQHLSETYSHITQIPNEKVLKIEGIFPEFTVTTNKSFYKTKTIVIGIGSANTFAIDGLMDYVVPHQKALPEKHESN
jgi:thioredoxin reductase